MRKRDTFLIVTPGITIRDRLRVLKPNAPDNYYEERDLLPHDLFQRLQAATVVITNYHAFLRRDKFGASTTTVVRPSSVVCDASTPSGIAFADAGPGEARTTRPAP